MKGNEVTFYGDALDGGALTRYVVHVVDGGKPGGRADSFSILTATGLRASGPLTGGDIRCLPAVQRHAIEG